MSFYTLQGFLVKDGSSLTSSGLWALGSVSLTPLCQKPRDQGRGPAEFPMKLCENSVSCFALQKENTSKQQKHRLFNVEILSLPSSTRASFM